jgi:hypothetical protein
MYNLSQKLLVVGIVLLGAIFVPLLIKALFWILLQIFNYPLQALLISVIFICLLYLLPKAK